MWNMDLVLLIVAPSLTVSFSLLSPRHRCSSLGSLTAVRSRCIWPPAPSKKSGPHHTGPFDYEAFYKVELDKKHQDKSYRYFNNINRLASRFPMAHTSQSNHHVTVWCSNDYLGMGRHPEVINSMKSTLDLYGAGAGGTRNIAGNAQLHLNLEKELADLHGKTGALVFSSCYVANDATLATLGSKMPGCVILSDAKNHASMIQGIIHSRARKVVFKVSRNCICACI